MPLIGLSIDKLQSPQEQLKSARRQLVLPIVELLQPLQVSGVQIILHKVLISVPKPSCIPLIVIAFPQSEEEQRFFSQTAEQMQI